MKIFQSILLFLVFGLSFAADENTAISHAVDTRIALLQAESGQLDSAIFKLTTMELTDNEKFELIAEAAFQATEEAVASYGMTIKQLYAFEAKHQTEMTAWLDAHTDQVQQISMLESEIESLQSQFDQAIGQRTSE
ncbi:MAG: hypothetical protein ABW168_21685 [Sedimenticola sp.]